MASPHGCPIWVIAAISSSTRHHFLSTSPIQVGRARLPQDLDGIRECRAAAFDAKQALRHSQRSFVNATAVAEGRSICLLAREEQSSGRVLGTADVKFRAADSSMSIHNVFVRPDARGRGIGKRLLQGIEKTAADKGARRLKLEVSTSNVTCCIALPILRVSTTRNT